MKLLIVSPRFPFQKGKADSMTVFHLIEYLHEQGHQVLLATFDAQEDFPSEERQRVLAMCEVAEVLPIPSRQAMARMLRNVLSNDPFQVAYYRSSAMRKAIDNLIVEHQPDVLYAHLIRAAHYLEPYGKIPKVVGMQIAQTLNYGRLIQHERNWLRRLFYQQEYRRVKRYEPEVVTKFERILLISPHDKKAISPNSADDKVFFNPHGIDVAYYAEPQGVERLPNVICMNGDFGVPTNIDGAMNFYENIFPLVRQQVPDAQLWLVGRNPHASVLALAEKDAAVTVTGRVPDIRPYLQQASVGIAPMRVAAGLQNKILVSLAASLPVVATSIANEGIRAPKTTLLEADEPTQFAKALVQLLQDPIQARSMGAAAHSFVQERWTWEYHFQKLENMLTQLVDRPSRAVTNYYPFSSEPVRS